MKISPPNPQNKNLNTIVQHNYSDMHASLSNFNLFLKTLPLNEKALGGKSFPLTFNGKNYNEFYPNPYFHREKEMLIEY